MMGAAKNDRLDIVKTLLAANASVDITSNVRPVAAARPLHVRDVAHTAAARRRRRRR